MHSLVDQPITSEVKWEINLPKLFDFSQKLLKLKDDDHLKCWRDVVELLAWWGMENIPVEIVGIFALFHVVNDLSWTQMNATYCISEKKS